MLDAYNLSLFFLPSFPHKFMGPNHVSALGQLNAIKCLTFLAGVVLKFLRRDVGMGQVSLGKTLLGDLPCLAAALW